MALVRVPYNTGNFTALSTDISDSKITGANIPGAYVYITDTGKTYVVKSDLTLAEVIGENVVGKTTGITQTASVVITTTASQGAYIAGDAVLKNGNGLSEITSIARVNGGTGYITGIRVSTNKKSITPRLRLHFYNASNATISNDNAPWKDLYADALKRLGTVDMVALSTAQDSTNSDMSMAQDYTTRLPFICAANSTSLWVGLETLDGFTPDNSQEFTIIFYTEVN